MTDRKEAPPDKLLEAAKEYRSRGILAGTAAEMAEFGREIAEQCAKLAHNHAISVHWGTCQDISEVIRNHFQLGAKKP